MMTAQEKVGAQHLARMAYLYVRQSTLRQVFDPLQKGEVRKRGPLLSAKGINQWVIWRTSSA